MGIDIAQARRDFPILSTKVNKHDLVYFDNAATTQMPREVMDRIVDHYCSRNANVHRGIHTLSERSTSDYEEARNHVARFINAESDKQIVFTSGTTESINLVASSFLRSNLKPGDAVVVTVMEHHANFVPWQIACKQTGASFEVIPVDGNGDVDSGRLRQALHEPNVKLLSLCWISNITGGINPIEGIVKEAHEAGVPVLVDAAQAARHIPIDVQRIGCDFLCFSGHKMFGPTGIGVLYCSPATSELLQPVRFGGGMVDKVTNGNTTFEPMPMRLEAGTPNYIGAIGLSAALSYIERIGRHGVQAREEGLTALLLDSLSSMETVEIVGSPKKRSGIVSFTVEGLSPFDIAKILDLHGIAVRSGANCAQPLLREAFHIDRVIRASLAFYNTEAEIDRFAECLLSSIQLLRAAL